VNGVFQAINDWLADPKAPPFFLITGGPGSGKTAISCRLYQFSIGETILSDGMTYLKRGFLDAIHFCSSADERWINQKTFTESLTNQLSERYPIYRKKVLEKIEDRKVSPDMKVSMQNVTAGGDVAGIRFSVNLGNVSAIDGFNRTVREPLEELYRHDPSQKIIILVDALDEALSYKEMTNIADITKSQYLSTNVRFILTLRQEADTLRALRHRIPKPKEIPLTSGSGLIQSGKDIREHTLKMLSTSKDGDLENKLASDLSPDNFADTIQRKSEGNFLYVKYLIHMLKDEEKITIESLDNFPSGLDEIYFEFLDRLVKSKVQNVEDYLSVLGILTVSQEALTEAQISNFVQMDKDKVRRLLASLRQLLDTDDSVPATQRKYSIYHRSFSEFLLNADKSEGYWCGDTSKNHKRLVEYYKTEALSEEKVDWSKIDDYGMLYLSSHIYALIDNTRDKHANEYRQELYDLIGKTFKDEKFRRFGSYQSYIQDIELVIKTAYSEKPPNILQILRGALIHTILSTVAIDLPLNIFWALAMIGEETSALGFAALMNKQSRAKALCIVGEALLIRGKIGDMEKCKSIFLEILKSVMDEPSYRIDEQAKIDLLSRIGAHLIEFGEYNKVLSTAKTIEGQTQVLTNIVKDLFCAKKFDRALRVAKEIEDTLGQSFALSELVQALVNNGAFEEAMKIIEKDIKEWYWKSLSLSAIANIHFGRNEKMKAIEIAKMAKQKAHVNQGF
jgi:hypothetical protein